MGETLEYPFDSSSSVLVPGSLLLADWDTLPASSRPQNPIGEDDQSKLPFEGFIH